ncbi:hypothetical protein MKX83_24080 [Cytobacillus sp. FSL M8-0252]|uniref:hypothetical protein n=1 Tax=Cytobacillus sp. FSL M8-0252 TaxID=2921621 RepID=UPI0030FCBE50
MKSIEMIFNRFPNVKNKYDEPSNPQIILTNQEAVFYNLVQFFNQPDAFQFSLNMIYEYLKDEDLLFAMEVSLSFFQSDTSLVQNVEQTYYDRNLMNEKIVGQKGFSRMVEENIEGIKFKPSMIHVYWHRNSGRIPNADLIIDGTPYWLEKTVESFIEREREYRKRKKEGKK